MYNTLIPSCCIIDIFCCSLPCGLYQFIIFFISFFQIFVSFVLLCPHWDPVILYTPYGLCGWITWAEAQGHPFRPLQTHGGPLGCLGRFPRTRRLSPRHVSQLGGPHPRIPVSACFPFIPGGVGHRSPAVVGGACTVVVCMDAQGSTISVCPRRLRTARATLPPIIHQLMGFWQHHRTSLTATPTFPLAALRPGDSSVRPRCISDLVGSRMPPSAHARTPHLSVRTPD